MPTRPPQFNVLSHFRARGLIRPSAVQRDERRGTSHERGYGARWQATREGFLRSNPLCVCCKANGVIEPATVVDHVIPHRGDPRLFWARDNWQALSKQCHDKIKRIIEDRWERGEIGPELLRLNRPLPEFFAPSPGGA